MGVEVAGCVCFIHCVEQSCWVKEISNCNFFSHKFSEGLLVPFSYTC